MSKPSHHVEAQPADCSAEEVDRLQALFSSALEETCADSTLPDPGPIWRRAYQERRRALARRALLPTLIGHG